jgi:hypothetical protein
MALVALFQIVGICRTNVRLDGQVLHHDESPAPDYRDSDKQQRVDQSHRRLSLFCMLPYNRPETSALAKRGSSARKISGFVPRASARW